MSQGRRRNVAEKNESLMLLFLGNLNFIKKRNTKVKTANILLKYETCFGYQHYPFSIVTKLTVIQFSLAIHTSAALDQNI